MRPRPHWGRDGARGGNNDPERGFPPPKNSPAVFTSPIVHQLLHAEHYRTSSPTIARALEGLAAPIRSARMRARTSVLRAGHFHALGV